MSQLGREGGPPTLEGRVGQLRSVVDLLERKMSAEFGCDLDRSLSSVAYLDAVLAGARETRRALAPTLFLSIGGYLGDVLIEVLGGRWSELDGELAITLEGEGHERTVQVFDWVKQAYADPSGHSLGARVRGLVGDGLDGDVGAGR